MAAFQKFIKLLTPSTVSKVQNAGIVSKYTLRGLGPKPKPYPYKTHSYNVLTSVFEKTTWRFDENSKIIVVDGPIEAGKEEFAKQLADELDMRYVSHANLDTFYINPYGYDFRTMNDELPFLGKSFDIHEFLKNPSDKRTTRMQQIMYYIRLSDYVNCLAHLLSTGEGIVMNRSVYSDFVFVETLAKFGYVTKAFMEYYYKVKQTHIDLLMRPHLIIYLDVSPSVIQQRLKAKGMEDSPFYRTEVLEYMEKIYKQKYLTKVVDHSELLAYDWTEKGDTEMIVEDIEKVNLDDYNPSFDSKMSDWRFEDELSWCDQRRFYCMYKDDIMEWVNISPAWDCQETNLSGEENLLYSCAWDELPGNKYDVGFNPDCGDANVWSRFTRTPLRPPYTKDLEN